VHFVLLPHAFVGLAIGPGVLAFARDFVLEELALVDATVSELQFSFAVLLSILV